MWFCCNSYTVWHCTLTQHVQTKLCIDYLACLGLLQLCIFQKFVPNVFCIQFKVAVWSTFTNCVRVLLAFSNVTIHVDHPCRPSFWRSSHIGGQLETYLSSEDPVLTVVVHHIDDQGMWHDCSECVKISPKFSSNSCLPVWLYNMSFWLPIWCSNHGNRMLTKWLTWTSNTQDPPLLEYAPTILAPQTVSSGCRRPTDTVTQTVAAHESVHLQNSLPQT